jgi:hypothetical protein
MFLDLGFGGQGHFLGPEDQVADRPGGDGGEETQGEVDHHVLHEADVQSHTRGFQDILGGDVHRQRAATATEQGAEAAG